MPRRTELVRLDIAPGSWLQGQWSHEQVAHGFAVVFVHGFVSVRYGEKARAVEEECARRGWAFAAFDFRGHGESSGTLRELRGSNLLADLAAVQAFLARQGCPRLCFVGSSMGGWASAWYGLRHPEQVIASAFIAPGFHFVTARWDRCTEAQRLAWRRDGVMRVSVAGIEAELGIGLVDEAPHFLLEKLLREYSTPTLIFQGMKDDVVPHARVIDFVEKCACPELELRLFKDGDHRLVERRHDMAQSACDFFARRLAKPAYIS